MKKENFVIGLIGVAVVFFLLGRFSVSTTNTTDGTDDAGESAQAPTEDAKGADTDKQASNDSAKPAVAGKAVAAPTAKAGAAAPVKKVAGSLNVMASPRKGAAVAKVTIMEISDFQ